MFQIFGLILALATLIIFVFKKVPTIFSVIIAALVAAVFNQVEIWSALNTLANGVGSTFSSYLFVFLLSTIYGQLMSSIGCAQALANFFIKLFGKKNVVLIIIITTAVLVYGGVSAMVVSFTIAPLGFSLLREANISKSYLPGLICFGAATFALFLPGSPQLNNIIPIETLGTSSTASPLIGIIAAVIMMTLGLTYFNGCVKKDQSKGIGFDPSTLPANYKESKSEEKLPGPMLSILPIIILILCNMLFENVDIFGYHFADHGSLSAICTAMFVAIIYLIVLGCSFGKKTETFAGLKAGATSWINPCLNFCMIVGFGYVIKATAGFESLVQFALSIPGEKYISASISVCLLAGVTGSASGGMRIALSSETLVNSWLASSANIGTLHRLISIASCGLDSLPHCGGILATLNACNETHSSAYIHLFITTVIFPIIAAIIVVTLACLGLTY